MSRQVTALVQKLKADRWRQVLMFSPVSAAAGIYLVYKIILAMARTKQ